MKDPGAPHSGTRSPRLTRELSGFLKHLLASKTRQSDHGSALILTLLITALLATIVVSFLSTSRVEQIAARNFSRQNAASGLAEMATQQAMANLQTAFNDNGSMTGRYAAVVTSQPGGITKYFFQNGNCSTNGTVPLFFTSNSTNANDTVNMNNLDNSTSTTSPTSGLITGNRSEAIAVARVNILNSGGNQTIGRIAYYIDDESTKINLNSLAGTRGTLNAGYGKAQSLSGVASSASVNGSANFTGNLSFVNSIVNGLAPSSNNSITTWASFFRPEQAQASFSINSSQIKHYSAAPLSDFHLKYTPWGTPRLFINDEPTNDTGVSNVFSALTGLDATTNIQSGSPNSYEINGMALKHIFNGTFSDKYSINGTKQIAANMLQLRDRNTTGWNGIYWNGGLIGSGNLSSTGIPQSYLGYIPPAAINEVAIQSEKDETNGTLNICVYVELWAPMWDYGAANFALNVNLQSATFSSGNSTLTFPNQSLWQNVTLQTYGRYVQRFVFSQPATSFNGTLNIAMGDIKLLASQANAASIRDWITGSVINSLLPINTTINSTQTVNYTASSPWNTSQNMTSIQRKDIRIRQDSSGVYSLSNNSVTNPWLVQKHTFPPEGNNYNFIKSYSAISLHLDDSDNGNNGGSPNWILQDPYIDYSSWPADFTCQGSNLPIFRFYNNNRYFFPLLIATDMNGDGIFIWPADLGKVMTDKMYRTLRMWWQPPEERALGFVPDWALLDLVSFSSNNSAKFPLKIAPMNLNGRFNSLSASPPSPRNNLQCLTISYDTQGNVTSYLANSTNRTYYNSFPPGNRGNTGWLGAGAGVSLSLSSNLTQHIMSNSPNSTIAWSKTTGNKTWSAYRTSKGWPSKQIVIPSEITEIKSVADYTVAPNTDPALRPMSWYWHYANSEGNENRLAAFFPGLTLCSNFFTIYAYAQAGQLKDKNQPESASNPFVADSEALTKSLVEVEITTPATATAPAQYKVKKLYTQPIPMGQ